MDAQTETPSTCQEYVYGGGFGHGHVCGRLVKDDGLCGLHLSAKRRRAERSAAYDRERSESRARGQAAQDAAVKLADAYGIDRREIQAEYGSFKIGYTGALVLSPVAVNALLAGSL